ncbi:MAG: hypothetical protein M0R74_18255 [Dehalococcoidia bacterium]|nr:hypothetical protein [Dehalococcoidia bacterium]
MKLRIPNVHPDKQCTFLHITWDVLKRVITSLSRQIPENATIWGVPRGGEFIALQLSYLRPDLEVIHCGAVECVDGVLSYEVPSHAIIVDDIVDTGETILDAHHNHYATAAAFVRAGAQVMPTFAGIVIKSKSWLIFPWEYEQLELPK